MDQLFRIMMCSEKYKFEDQAQILIVISKAIEIPNIEIR